MPLFLFDSYLGASFFFFFVNIASDPAINDSSLERKLRSNREVALGSLEEVINKYALKQDDAEEEDRRKRLEKDKAKKEVRWGKQ